MHSSLVTTIKGVPLGLAAVKFWTRKKFKGSTALKRKINLTRVPIGEKESVRWLTKAPSTPGCEPHAAQARDALAADAAAMGS